jgi:outer membrane protein OmpA-like peptidoglycan-associated protein
MAVHFVAGQAALTDEGRAALRRTLALAKTSEHIEISGRTDATGSDAINQASAFARALAVRDYLINEAPVLPDIISLSARGGCCFIADNASAEGRLKNRRVEVIFTSRSNTSS